MNFYEMENASDATLLLGSAEKNELINALLHRRGRTADIGNGWSGSGRIV